MLGQFPSRSAIQCSAAASLRAGSALWCRDVTGLCSLYPPPRCSLTTGTTTHGCFEKPGVVYGSGTWADDSAMRDIVM